MKIKIGKRLVGTGEPCYVIAEAGVNHNGDMALATKLIDAAAEAGADAVKFQSFRAEQLVTPDAPKAEYQAQRTGAVESQQAMLKKLELTLDDHRMLIAHAESRGIQFLSTPFDEPSADLLNGLNVPAFKLPSGELTNLPFLKYVAKFGKPIILSTGMATLAEVDEAVTTLEDAGCTHLILLHCVSNYPANASDSNLRAMTTMHRAFGLPVGYSDHTLGNEVCFASVALGACVVEKHITLDRAMPGPDHAASAEPEDFDDLVDGIRTIQSAIGNGRMRPAPSELGTAKVARKSLITTRDIPEGTALTADDLAVRRPGTGLSPKLLSVIVGRTARRTIPAGTLLQLEMLG